MKTDKNKCGKNIKNDNGGRNGEGVEQTEGQRCKAKTFPTLALTHNNVTCMTNDLSQTTHPYICRHER